MLKLPENKTKIVNCSSVQVPRSIHVSQEPLILKNLVSSWDIIQHADGSLEKSIDYLNSFTQDEPIAHYSANSNINGRYFYNKDMTGLNFETSKRPLADLLEQLKSTLGDPKAPSLYMGSTSIDYCLPGFRQANDLDFNYRNSADGKLTDVHPLISIWLGNQSRIACHYDVPSNIACNVVGKRRFCLFPPEQIENLYPGPIDFTPAGQAVSMVDFAEPDWEKFPLFEKALRAGQVAELEPGDALFVPSMWWHHVEGLSQFNTLVNYWWRNEPKYLGQPMNVLYHGLLSIRDLPINEKQAWKQIFDYYLFGDPDMPCEHLPEHSRGLLNPINDDRSRQLRTLLINRLNQ